MTSIVQLPSDALAYGADYTRDYWHAWVEPHTQIDDVRKSSFWVHHLPKLKAGALVDLMTRDGFFDISVRIINVQNGLVRANVIRHYEDVEAREPIIEAWFAKLADGKDGVPGFERARDVAAMVPDGYKVGWNPGKGTFYLQYRANGMLLLEGLTDEMAGVRAARAHARAAGFSIEWDETIEGKQPAKDKKAA
jgi:hypothetical protein